MRDESFAEEPQVECGYGTITINVKTRSGKPSYIFAKGHFRKEGCMFKSTNTATFTFERCNINRKRELFITKVDHAYNVRCFYMETNKEVNAELGVR
uniref:ZP domain-containing protein n=1 Tax=Ascaris lumbricoides TaxID=6252 RepID=A0A0M3ILT6_ASCLU